MRAATQGESGFVLMEALVVSMLVAITFLGLLGALFTGIRSSEVNRHVQRMEAALMSYGETLKSMPVYFSCGTGPDAHAAQPYLFGFDYTTQVKSPSGMAWQDPQGMVLKVQPAVKVMANDGTWSSYCPLARDNSGNRDSGIQLLTLEVTSKGRTITGHVVKTRPLS
ncbi:MAG: hypothetical protein M5U19_09655 [Microthrixaceae bacterium]|nr:hypothetical protein [Microthrixaceae bacterium]